MTEQAGETPTGELAALVVARAHDLTNLLGVARNYAALAGMQLKDHPAHADVATIQHAADKALAIIAELVTAARAADASPADQPVQS